MQLTRPFLLCVALLVGTSSAAPAGFLANIFKGNSPNSTATSATTPALDCKSVKPGHITMSNNKVCTGPLRARQLLEPEQDLMPRLFGLGKKPKPGSPEYDAKVKQTIMQFQSEKDKKVEKAEKEMKDKMDKLLKKEAKSKLTIDCATCPPAWKDKITNTVNEAWKSSPYKVYEKCRIKDVVQGSNSVNASAYFYNGNNSFSSGTRATLTL